MDASSRIGPPKPKADQAAVNFTSSEARTSYYSGSMADNEAHADDGRTNVSSYSYRSGLDANKYLKEAHGRTFNALNETYYLPSDDDEWNRLEKQHTAFLLSLGGLYPAAAKVPALLQPKEGEAKKILDLGCGTGVWTIAMAREFPHVQIIGVDLAPIPVEPETLPSNCRFEVADINLGLARFEGQCDLVHVRLVGSGFKDFLKALSDVEKCLKPGGLLLWLDVDYDILATTSFTYSRPPASELNPSGAWLVREPYEVRRSLIMGGSDIPTMEKTIDAGVWDRPIFDPETCKTASLYLPIGPWAASSNPAQDQLVNYVGALMRQDVKSATRGVQPLLIRSGWSQETLTVWSDRIDEELSHLKDQLSVRVRIAWGRRRAAENMPAPPLPPVEEDTDASPRTHYPYYRVYNTREESLAQAALRSQGKNLPPPSHPADAKEAVAVSQGLS